ncbi:mRNA surveillance protein pelota [Candidatus Micrarchaeota archaeon]|nr:mRNA surveillance protein pelota [Candidatus Micrarchaeota archaeon]
MRVLRFEETELKGDIETLEDLWLLSRIIERGDKLIGTSFRRVKALDLQRADSGEKKRVKLLLEIDQVEYAEASNKLRVTGKILEASPPEFAQQGQFHTLDLEIHTRFTLIKAFQIYHKKLLEEARKKARAAKALIIAMDEHHALFATLQQNGLRFLFEIENQASKRDAKTFSTMQQQFFEEVLEAAKKRKAERMIIAGPGFTKDEFKRFAQNKDPVISKTFWFEHASSAEKTAVFELLKKGLLQKVVSGQKIQDEFLALERLKKSLGTLDGFAVYGIEPVREALSAGAVDTLLIADSLLRSDKSFNSLLEQSEKLGARILIFNSEDDAGKEFAAFQLAALLRFKLTY